MFILLSLTDRWFTVPQIDRMLNNAAPNAPATLARWRDHVVEAVRRNSGFLRAPKEIRSCQRQILSLHHLSQLFDSANTFISRDEFYEMSRRQRTEFPEKVQPSFPEFTLAKPKQYPVWLRFANGRTEVENNYVSDTRSMAVKVLGVEGERLRQSHESKTQDIIVQNAEIFFIKTIKDYYGFFVLPLSQIKQHFSGSCYILNSS